MNSALASLFKGIPIPPMAPAAQSFPDEHVGNVGQAVLREMEGSLLARHPLRGMDVAIAVGSRGICRLPEIVNAVVGWFAAKGARPFLVPAMGSHGGATAAGQVETLSELGVTEASAGCSIRASMDVEQVGSLPDGQPVYLDRHAALAGGIFVINRVKPHTAFRARHESGLVKMITIGLGKQRGADSCHQMGFGRMPAVMVEMARLIVDRKPLLGGLGVVENAHDNIHAVAASTAESIFDCDARLLDMARSLMPSLPIRDLDVLIVDEMGKNISGAGLDGAITGRFATPYASNDMKVAKLAVLDLTEESSGNATGMGNADIITRRLYDKIDFVPTYANGITTTLFKSVFMPMVMESDMLAVQCALQTCNAGARPLRVMRIRNTLDVTRFMVSPALAEEVQALPQCSLCGDFAPLPFDAHGSMTDLGGWAAPSLSQWGMAVSEAPGE